MHETRRKIAKATFELHGTVGPAYTTISAVADRAGVQRGTVYRHFPDEVALFRACVTHGYEVHPAPDPDLWSTVTDPERRLRRALRELFAYYGETESVWVNVSRDMPGLPSLQIANAEAGTFERWGRMREMVVSGWRVRGARKRLLEAAVGLSLDFGTWHTLTRVQGLTDDQTIELLAGAVRAAAGRDAAPSARAAGSRSRTGARGRTRTK